MREAYRHEEEEREKQTQSKHFVYDLFLMSAEKREMLKQRIERAKAKIFLFVHPSWADEDSFVEDELKRRAKSVRQGLLAISNLESDDIPPIFVMEKDRSGKNYIGPNPSGRNQDIFWIPTEMDGPQPVYKAYNRERTRGQRDGKITNVR